DRQHSRDLEMRSRRCYPATFKPSQETRSGVSGDLKLDWSASFLLYNHRSRSDRRPNHKCADLDLYEITTSKFAIQRQVEESSISHPTFTVEEDAYRPYLFNLPSAFGADLSASVPSRPSCRSRIIL